MGKGGFGMGGAGWSLERSVVKCCESGSLPPVGVVVRSVVGGGKKGLWSSGGGDL